MSAHGHGFVVIQVVEMAKCFREKLEGRFDVKVSFIGHHPMRKGVGSSIVS